MWCRFGFFFGSYNVVNLWNTIFIPEDINHPVITLKKHSSASLELYWSPDEIYIRCLSPTNCLGNYYTIRGNLYLSATLQKLPVNQIQAIDIYLHPSLRAVRVSELPIILVKLRDSQMVVSTCLNRSVFVTNWYGVDQEQISNVCKCSNLLLSALVMATQSRPILLFKRYNSTSSFRLLFQCFFGIYLFIFYEKFIPVD